MNNPRIALSVSLAVVVAASLWPREPSVSAAPQVPVRAAAPDDAPPVEAVATAYVAAPVALLDAAGRAAAPTAEASSARGVIRPLYEATLSSRAAARILSIPRAEGMKFKKGDVLVRFDCERAQAEARAADSAVMVQAKTVETNVELDQFNAIGKNDLLISKSQLAKVVAESEAMKSQLRDCTLLAPFSGRVVERLAHAHESVSGSQPLLKIVDTKALELDLIVPSAWLQWLAPGAELVFAIDETGQKVAATVTRLTRTVDPVSKTTRVIAEFDDRPGKRMLPGMSGTALFAGAGRP